MSTKTTFKRIALVAVAALGFGMVSAVPSNAASVTASAIAAGTIAPSRAGVATTIPVTVTHSAITGGDTAKVTFTVVSKPASSAATIIVGAANTTATESATTKRGTIASPAAASATVVSNTVVNGTTSATKTITDLVITPDVPGTYVILASVGAGSTYAVGDVNSSITVTTVGTPSKIELSTVNSVIATNGANGSPLKIVLKDADGNVTKPNALEAIKLTSVTGSATFSSSSLGSSAFASGSAIVNVRDTVASDSVVVTASGDGAISSSVASSISFTSSANASLNTAAGTATWQQGTGVATTGFLLASQTSLVFPSTATSQSIGLASLTANGTVGEATAASTKYATLVITDTTGAITGTAGTVFDRVVSQGPAGATISSAATFTATLGTTGSYTVSNALNANVLTVTGATAVATTTAAISPASITAPLASTNTFTSKITDQFGVAVAGAAVQASVSSGRNSAQAVKNLVSDASGFVSFTLTDSGTTGTTDTISFVGPTTVTRTLTYAAVTVGSVTLTGGNTTAGVTATTPTLRDIDAGAAGVQATTYAFSATVKDANGNPVTGVPVSWTVTGTGAAVLSTTANTYTNASGVASASIYGWIAGTYTVTATAGGKTGTGTITFAQTAAGDERVLSATVNGPVVTAKVVDRFGNVVPNVTIWATETGAGYFGNGVTRTSSTTDANGTADFIITGGDANVTLYTYNPATAGAVGSGQSCARAGAADCGATAADDTAFTATAAGTALVAEKGVGASFAPAGVSTVTVALTGVNAAADNAQASADAAAEATDAANAATDAANAAAEAADAATAAAQDAADAVAALATQVNEQISELKAMNMALQKQITALTNLIIKIQKKVKA